MGCGRGLCQSGVLTGGKYVRVLLPGGHLGQPAGQIEDGRGPERTEDHIEEGMEYERTDEHGQTAG